MTCPELQQEVVEPGLEPGLATRFAGRGLWPGARGLASGPQLPPR